MQGCSCSFARGGHTAGRGSFKFYFSVAIFVWGRKKRLLNAKWWRIFWKKLCPSPATACSQLWEPLLIPSYIYIVRVDELLCLVNRPETWPVITVTRSPKVSTPNFKPREYVRNSTRNGGFEHLWRGTVESSSCYGANLTFLSNSVSLVMKYTNLATESLRRTKKTFSIVQQIYLRPIGLT